MPKMLLKLKTNTYRPWLLFLGTCLAVVSCSTKKDKFINRQWQALNTKYNVMYNGNMALDKGLADLKIQYKDNYWEVLPIERMAPKADALPELATAENPGKTSNPDFDRAEEKATKAVQKRSMNIGGKERNAQMDEAHLLLGKSRYYEQRFVPALEAFNYILYKYPESDKIYEAKIWRERTNMRMGNDALAVKNLQKLLSEIKFKDQVYADANATLAQAFLNLEQPDSVMVRLKRAIGFTKSHEEEARYYFIAGQVYEQLNQKDSAFAYYQKVIDMKRQSPRKYIIEAHARQARQYDYEKGDTLAFLKKYADLLKDRENRPYLDVVNQQMAIFYDKRKKYPQAIVYYNKSLRTISEDEYLMATNYRNLAQIHFNTAKYQTAGQYYDSTLVYLKPRTREYNLIAKKRKNLEDVIKFEGIAQHHDSILNVVSLSESDRRSFYEDHIAKLRKKDEEKARKEKALQDKLERENRQMDGDDTGAGIASKAGTTANDPRSGKTPPPVAKAASGGTSTASGEFYFYNAANVAFGKQDFKKKWGSRPLTENWRLSSVKKEEVKEEEADSTATASGKDGKGEKALEPKYNPEFYLGQLPTSKIVLDSLWKERNFAYYQLGVIYKEKFKEYPLAASKLEQLLENKPEERLVLPTYYHLYKIYEILDKSKAAAMKQQIISQYPESRYAQILNSNSPQALSDASPEVVYNQFYQRYQQGNYRTLLPDLVAAIDQYTGDEIVPKLELLKARTAGKLKGFADYKSGLNFTALNYPNSEEGKEAEQLLSKDVPLMEKRQFYKSKPESWKILYKMGAAAAPEKKKLLEILTKFTSERTSEKLKLSTDIYTEGEDFIVIHGIPSEQKAKDIATILRDYKDYLVKPEAVVISNENYIIVQMRKNLTEYLATPFSEPDPDPTYAPVTEKKTEEKKIRKPAKKQQPDPTRRPTLSPPEPGMPGMPDSAPNPAAKNQKAQPAGNNNSPPPQKRG